jgi:hypothetical protein
MILQAFLDWRYHTFWEEEFHSNKDRVITPDNKTVEDVSSGIDSSSDTMDTVVDVWLWTYENINYELTKSWRTPQTVIKTGYGDCEDVTFVILSICLNLNIDYMDIKLGRLRYPDGDKPPENHVWLEYDGYIIDGTTHPSHINNPCRYRTIDTYTIRNGEYS